jgi:hypothetical protein
MRRITLCLLAWLTLSLGLSAQSAQIVKSVRLLNQTGPVPPTTIYTPNYPGMFRVSVALVLTQANGTDSEYEGWVSTKYGQTSGSTIASWYLYVKDLSHGMNGGVTTVMSDAAQPIQFSTNGIGDVTGAKYDVYIVVEHL